MVRLRYLLVGFVILLIGIIFWSHRFSGEEKRVIRQFKLLSQYIEKSSDEDLISVVNRIKKISRLFTDPCEFKIEDDPLYSFTGSYTREEIGGYALRGRSYFSDLSLRFDDYRIEFLDKFTAHVKLTGRLSGRSSSGEKVDEVRELFCELKKMEKSWLFSRFEVIEVLKR